MPYDAIVFLTEKFVNFVMKLTELLKLRGMTSKSDTIHTYILINLPTFVHT